MSRGSTRSSLPIATFAASPNGVVVWRLDNRTSPSQLQWFDRNGKALGVVGEVADYSNPVLSPDDSKLAVSIRDPQTKTRTSDFDLVRGGKTRLTFDPADDLDCVWSPDGTRIVFTSDRSGQRNIYWKLADGSRPEELLLGGKDGQENVEDWSRTENIFCITTTPTAHRPNSMCCLSTGIESRCRSSTRHSPPSRVISHRMTVGSPIARRNRDGTRSSFRGSTWIRRSRAANGRSPRTEGSCPDGAATAKELFFHFADSFFAVDVTTDGPAFTAGIPKRLFDIPGVSASSTHGEFVVTRDGQRFLVAAATEKAVAQPIEVVVNWR